MTCRYLIILVLIQNRRNWFLERILKLGLTPIAKEYQCVRLILFISRDLLHYAIVLDLP